MILTHPGEQAVPSIAEGEKRWREGEGEANASFQKQKGAHDLEFVPFSPHLPWMAMK